MSIDWKHIRDELQERKDAQGLTKRQQSVLDSANAALRRGERWMSESTRPDRESSTPAQ